MTKLSEIIPANEIQITIPADAMAVGIRINSDGTTKCFFYNDDQWDFEGKRFVGKGMEKTQPMIVYSEDGGVMRNDSFIAMFGEVTAKEASQMVYGNCFYVSTLVANVPVFVAVFKTLEEALNYEVRLTGVAPHPAPYIHVWDGQSFVGKARDSFVSEPVVSEPVVSEPLTYTLTVTEFGTETIRIEAKNLEFCLKRAESIARSYGLTPVMYRDGTVYTDGDTIIKIVSQNGFSMEDEAFSWGCTPEELEILKRNGAFAVMRHREAKTRQEKWASLPRLNFSPKK